MLTLPSATIDVLMSFSTLYRPGTSEECASLALQGHPGTASAWCEFSLVRLVTFRG